MNEHCCFGRVDIREVTFLRRQQKRAHGIGERAYGGKACNDDDKPLALYEHCDEIEQADLVVLSGSLGVLLEVVGAASTCCFIPLYS